MARIITKELADAIVKKLGAMVSLKPHRAHDIANVWVENKLVATFGIRRGSQKDAGHDHIPNALHLGPRDTKLFGQCDITPEAWVEMLRAKRLL